ncbi:hypothetical protein [Sandaracinus amylolyticus]|uniref:Uncharacterized protein n=1 Tax=Sandaracinus amylolyticus TaxID=927083 RepID=A0A0F6YNG8_9BACT|nr:hypothetical protein [Sandaracinus amylolyticus]AKF11447.1 hypothetical protein DB32_008596 [Sandaracinus amylolyticus]
MDDAAEKAHARKVRLMARLTWPVLVAALMLVLGPAQLEGAAKAITLALMLGAVAGLNVPSWDVIRRARREGAPVSLVRALGFALALRLGAAVVIAVLLLR